MDNWLAAFNFVAVERAKRVRGRLSYSCGSNHALHQNFDTDMISLEQISLSGIWSASHEFRVPVLKGNKCETGWT